MRLAIQTVILAILILIASIIPVIFFGAFNVSAQWEDPPWLKELIIATREASIEKRAEDIDVPKLGTVEQIENGFRSYREMCAVCHVPPGGTKSPIALGLKPAPPDLSVVRDHAMSESELFWIIKNGIRMTGMPAWGASHGDDELWDIVSFVKALPGIDAAGYQKLDRETSPGHGHTSGNQHAEEDMHIKKKSVTDHDTAPISDVQDNHMGSNRH